MDYDVISNISLNFTLDTDLDPDESMSMIFHEIIFSIICLVGIIANGIIIYIINRFKNMKTTSNIYIMNWLISDSLYLLLTPCFYRIFSALEDLFIGEEIVCISFEFASILQITSITFILILCINWYHILYPIIINRKIYPFVIGGVWMMAFSGVITFSTFCARHDYSLLSNYMLFVGFAILLFLVIIMHITKALTKTSRMQLHQQLELQFTLITVYVICWCPSWLCLLVANIIDDYHILYYLSIVAACFGYLNSLINVYLFTKINRQFRMCLRQVFGCVHRDYFDGNQTFENDLDDVDDHDDDDDEYVVRDVKENDSIFVNLNSV